MVNMILTLFTAVLCGYSYWLYMCKCYLMPSNIYVLLCYLWCQRHFNVIGENRRKAKQGEVTIRLVKIKFEVELIPTETCLRYNERWLCTESPPKIQCRFATINGLKSCFTSHKLWSKSPPYHVINMTSSMTLSKSMSTVVNIYIAYWFQ